jgi:hypothetical protein
LRQNKTGGGTKTVLENKYSVIKAACQVWCAANLRRRGNQRNEKG